MFGGSIVLSVTLPCPPIGALVLYSNTLEFDMSITMITITINGICSMLREYQEQMQKKYAYMYMCMGFHKRSKIFELFVFLNV